MSRSPNTPEPVGVLFVCLGNICRSPLAEGIFGHLAGLRGVRDRFVIDSCGTGSWHAGGPADPRSVAIARRHGLALDHVARQYDPVRDPELFEHLMVMDRSNARHLIETGAPRDRVRLVRSFDPRLADRPEHELEVPDPYEWPGDGFEEVYQMLHAACGGLLESLVKRR